MYCDVTDWSCLSSQAPCLLLPKLPKPIDCRCSSVADACLRIKSRAPFCSGAPSACWTQPRRCHSHLCLPSPSVPLIRGSIRAKMSGRTGAEAPFEKSRHMRSHVSCDTNISDIYRRGSNRQRSLASLRSLTLAARQLLLLLCVDGTSVLAPGADFV